MPTLGEIGRIVAILLFNVAIVVLFFSAIYIFLRDIGFISTKKKSS